MRRARRRVGAPNTSEPQDASEIPASRLARHLRTILELWPMMAYQANANLADGGEKQPGRRRDATCDMNASPSPHDACSRQQPACSEKRPWEQGPTCSQARLRTMANESVRAERTDNGEGAMKL